jgi:hypothetical protein
VKKYSIINLNLSFMQLLSGLSGLTEFDLFNFNSDLKICLWTVLYSEIRGSLSIEFNELNNNIFL